MKNSNEHLVPGEEVLREDIETRLNYALDIPDDLDLLPAVNSMVDLLRSHHAHLKERVKKLKKEKDYPADVMTISYNQALDKVISLLE